jgi:hypothetical protein
MTSNRKPNRFPGTCDFCDTHVGAGDGYLVGKNHRNGPWLIAHNDCDSTKSRVRSHIAEARTALANIDPANIDEAIGALCEEHIMLAEIDNIFEPGSDIEKRHLAEMARISAEIARLETLKDNAAEAALADADRHEALAV